ncbi:hypothetical protein [Streptomyces sp. NPDC008121]|uniref:hypothetical protein n=1 Tax=Streptomyces sp. NPDC008121 TaxID=3364809 RepID=UPI0036E28893
MRIPSLSPRAAILAAATGALVLGTAAPGFANDGWSGSGVHWKNGATPLHWGVVMEIDQFNHHPLTGIEGPGTGNGTGIGNELRTVRWGDATLTLGDDNSWFGLHTHRLYVGCYGQTPGRVVLNNVAWLPDWSRPYVGVFFNDGRLQLKSYNKDEQGRIINMSPAGDSIQLGGDTLTMHGTTNPGQLTTNGGGRIETASGCTG